MEVTKYHALGNDYLVYDPKGSDMSLNEARIRLICDRHYGVGSDGILCGPEYCAGTPSVRIYNPDGSEAEKSGSGVRIFSKYLKDAGYVKEKSFTLSTVGGDVDVTFLNESGNVMRVFMGKLTFLSSEIPVSGARRVVVDEPMEFGGNLYRVTCVSIGNPHCVIPMEEIDSAHACELGPLVENSEHFPNRINMQLLKVIDRNNIQIEIYERGAGYTLASGTSSCAAAGAAHRLGLVDEHITVHMPGGTIAIEILPDESVYMTGRVHRVGTTVFSPEFIEDLKDLK